jgi:hypothetical protein
VTWPNKVLRKSKPSKPKKKDPRARPVPRFQRDETVVSRQDHVRRSRANEKRFAEVLGGRVASGSGNRAVGNTDKRTLGGDIKALEFLIEHKYTEKRSMSVKLDWLLKVEAGAQRIGKKHALGITFEEGEGRSRKDFMLIPLEVFEQLCRLSGIKND